MTVRFQELLDSLEFVSSSGVGENQAMLCRRTGKIYYRSALSGLDELNEESPDNIEDDDEYIAIPHKRELGLGKLLALDFAGEFLPNEFDKVQYIFSRRGAYQEFRALLTRRKALERWYAFEQERTEQALREWCEENSIDVEG